MAAVGLQRIDPGQAVHQIVAAGPGEGIAVAAAGLAEAGLQGRTGELHIRQIPEEGVQDSVDRTQGCKELGCMAQGYKVPAAAAAVRMRVVRLEEVSNSRPVAVVRTVVVVHIAAAAAVRIAEAVPETGNHLQEDRETVCSAVFLVGAAPGMVSPAVVAGLAQQMHRQQPDVLREAC
jgi:hypothetical protein